LTSVSIPNSVTSIENYAFKNCTELSYVGYLGTIDPGESSTGVFDDCYRLPYITVTGKYLNNSFCNKSISRRGVVVEIDLNSGLKPDEININELTQIIRQNETSTNDFIVEVVTDDSNNAVSILVYVDDKQTANTMKVQIEEKKEQCKDI